MGSFRRSHSFFDPLDLEIIDRVYEAAWAKIEGDYLSRDRSRDDERQKALRRWLFVLAARPFDFDTLYDRVVASVPKNWVVPHPEVASEVRRDRPSSGVPLS
jgi:hypothetical protein